jgi:hypothetical protein
MGVYRDEGKIRIKLLDLREINIFPYKHLIQFRCNHSSAWHIGGGSILTSSNLCNFRYYDLVKFIFQFYVCIHIIIRSRKPKLMSYGNRRSDHATPFYPQKLTVTSPTICGRSVGITHSRNKATELLLYIL